MFGNRSRIASHDPRVAIVERKRESDHDLARRCERAIRGDETPIIDAGATALGTGPTRKIVSDKDIPPPVTVS